MKHLPLKPPPVKRMLRYRHNKTNHLLTNEKYEYYNDVSSIQSDETLNPFITSLNANPPKIITAGSSTTIDKAPIKAPTSSILIKLK